MIFDHGRIFPIPQKDKIDKGEISGTSERMGAIIPPPPYFFSPFPIVKKLAIMMLSNNANS